MKNPFKRTKQEVVKLENKIETEAGSIRKDLIGKKIEVEICSKLENDQLLPLKTIKTNMRKRWVTFNQGLYFILGDEVKSEKIGRLRKRYFIRHNVDYSEPINSHGKVAPRSLQLSQLIIDQVNDDEAKAANVDMETPFSFPRSAIWYLIIFDVLAFLLGMGLIYL